MATEINNADVLGVPLGGNDAILCVKQDGSAFEKLPYNILKAGNLNLRGGYDASGSGELPTNAAGIGSGDAGAIVPGDTFYFSVDASLTVTGGVRLDVVADDLIIAKEAGPGADEISKWFLVRKNPPAADWGNIGGALSAQTDLASALNSKVNAADVPAVYYYLLQTDGIGGVTILQDRRSPNATAVTANWTIFGGMLKTTNFSDASRRHVIAIAQTTTGGTAVNPGAAANTPVANSLQIELRQGGGATFANFELYITIQITIFP